MTNDELTSLMAQAGPQTGARLQELTGVEVLELWTACRACPDLRFELCGRRFLRLDRTVDGYARLSPSIRREFQTYTVVGLKAQMDAIQAQAGRLRQETRAISRAKFDLARQAMDEVSASLGQRAPPSDSICFIMAGDVTYDMSHAVSRPEQSTGEMVRGSDLDVIVVADDGVPAGPLKALDNAIYKKKHFLLVHPDYREEIDYVIKDLSKVREQIRFDTFEHMVACKIMDEGRLLCGSRRLFEKVKGLIEEHGIHARLADMEEMARRTRDAAEATLLTTPSGARDADVLNLFYTREESEEIY